MNSQGIRAYFSGCLTTTLLPNPKLKGLYINDYVLCVDVSEAIVNPIKKRTDKKVICIGREQNICFTPEDRYELAKFTLFLYHNAHCVVTVALHAAIPSTAFGTPVCVIDEDDAERNTRFDGLEGLFHRVKEKDFLNNEDCYNIDNPPNNPKKYEEFRDDLVKTCTNFTGYDCNCSIFEDDYNPTLAISQIMKFKKSALDKALMFASGKDLIKTVIIKALHIKDKFSY